MQKFFDSVLIKGLPLVGATITVRKAVDNSIATVYSDNGINTKSNPFTTDANGRFEFYAGNDRYNITITGPGFLTTTIPDVLMSDITDGITKTIDANAPLVNTAQTWNNAAVDFTAVKWAVTGTARGSGSMLLDIAYNGLSSFSIDVGGAIFSRGHAVFGNGSLAINNNSGNAKLWVGSAFGWVASGLGSSDTTYPLDLSLYRDAADKLAQRRGTNPQTMRLYGTYTDASNYERGFLSWNYFGDNGLALGVEKLGTGVARKLYVSNQTNEAIIFRTNDAARWGIDGSGGMLYPITDNSVDIGTSALRVKSIYGAGGVTLGIATKTAAYTCTANDHTILGNATTAAFTVTLPASPTTGQIINVKKIDSSVNAVTIGGNGKNIDGASTKALSSQYASAKLQYDGAAWYVL